MNKMVAKLGGALLLAALVVPVNAHANTTGCIAVTSCTYIADGGDLTYTGITPAGSINVYRTFDAAPTLCTGHAWSASSRSCLIYSLVLPILQGGGTPVRSGTVGAFKNVATGVDGDTVGQGDMIAVSTGGIIANVVVGPPVSQGLHPSTPLGGVVPVGILKVADAA